MTDHEFKISQEEKSLAFLSGIAIGATCASLLIALYHVLKMYGL